MAARLGEILVQSGACSEEAIRDALKNQIIFGGRLGTNLLELQAVTEEALAKALGRQHAVPSLHGPQQLDAAALALVTPDIAERYDVIPFAVKDRRLAVVVVDPRNLAMLDEVAFVTGKAVQPVVAPEARVWALLREYYGIDRGLRGIDVDFAKIKGRIDVALGVGDAPAAPSTGAQPVAGDLMDEGEFSALYERSARTPAGGIPLAPPAPAPRSAAPLAAAPPGPSATPPPVRAAPEPWVATPPSHAAPPPPPADDDVIELTDLLLEPEPPVPPVRHAPPAQLAAPPRPEPEPSPLSFAEASRFLEGVTERDAIAKTVLRYARSKFRRAVLLTVHRGVLHGWAGLGEKLGPDAVRHIHLALGLPGILDTVVRTQAHFLGPIPKTESNIRLLKALGGGVPRNALLVPIRALGRVVNVFYVDNGKGGSVDSGDVGELLILATHIAKSYDVLLQRVA